MEVLTTIYPNNSILNKDSITETINNMYRTREHWIEVLHDDQNVWQCLHCNVKQYSINTSKMHLKTIQCHA